MSKYEQIIGWFENHWVTAVILIIIVVIMAIPQVRDGALLLWSWMKRLFQKHQKKLKQVITFHLKGEDITCTVLLRSLMQDVVCIDAHTHPLGIAAEYQWISQEYPDCKTVRQALTTLESMSGEKKKDDNQIYFDVITIKTKDDLQKDIYFDISSFFKGNCTSMLNSNEFLAKKIKKLYEK